MRTLPPVSHLLAIIGLLFAASVLRAQTGQAQGNAGGQIVGFTFPDTSAAVSGHALIALPAGTTPVGVTDDGTVILQSLVETNKFGYRWKNGQLTPLNLLPEMVAHPENYFMLPALALNPEGNYPQPWGLANRSGVVAATYYDLTNVGVVDAFIALVWLPGQANPERVVGPRLDLEFNAVDFVWLHLLNSQGRVWGEKTQPYVLPNGEVAPGTAFGVWTPPGYAAAEILVPAEWSASYGLNNFPVSPVAVNGSGVLIGRRDTIVGAAIVSNYFVGSPTAPTDAVDFEPRAINDAGWVLGRRTAPLRNILWKKTGPGAPVEIALPAGEIAELDDANNLHGLLPNGTKVTWTTDMVTRISDPVTGTYQPVAYVRPLLPAGWTSDLKVLPSSLGLKVGIGTFDNPATTVADPETRPFLLVPVSLAVDANRDSQIKLTSEDSTDSTSATQSFRFWINDDIDKLHTFADSAADSMDSVSETEEDDIGPAEASQFSWQADYRDGRIESKRDLEDFSRLWIQTLGLNAAFKNGDLKLGLKWTDVGGTTPAIQLYESVEADGGLGYLTDDAIAANQLLQKRNAITLINAVTGSAATQLSGAGTFVLPTSLFANPSDAQPKTFLLFEGCAVGKGQLKLVILKLGIGSTYSEIGEGPGVWMDLKKIGDMYEHWSVGNTSGGAPSAIAARVPSLTGSGAAFSYDNPTPSPEERKYILFVHGWNMEQWEKERFAETAFKRLWWQGYRGRFGLFTWPCTNRFDETSTLGKIIEGVSDGTHFDRGEWSAWRSGTPLRQVLQSLNGGYGGQLYVFSHSMGGIVMSEALRLHSDAGGGQIANVYVASQAALSAHLYDGTLSTAVGSASSVQWEYNHPSLPIGSRNYGPQTTNVYRNWLAYLLNGSATSSKAVGTLVNFYNQNDWALAAPVWQFNQITKPDWPDVFHSQPYRYGYTGDPAYFADTFSKRSGETIYPLALGTRADPQDRHEIMAFAAESYVKSFGATPDVSQGVSRSFDVRSIWLTDGGDHKAHIWHSAQFRSTMPKQKDYWKALLGRQAFDITTGVLP